MTSQHVDWHPADIVAGLRKKGTSLAAESRKAGLSSSTLANTLTRPWPKGELIIADVLGIRPWLIWPSRYHDSRTNEFIDRTLHIRKVRTLSMLNAQNVSEIAREDDTPR
ncbi:DNA-binding transcriptional regulator SfsB [Citrobacter sp. JGM124]|uniref:DNA-binding transcriptional regulator SfsB n=1 Tax=Citrobacter sp. JGM124 TaxID=2799789 RepID=UPI001BAD8376|nr:DNA-binding transcriptional regulator SfsB [Citrobacter sp. JGM124]MBS0849609.1 DNA-binding transcriptional regulator SfsB [Citrobacter sp. JGM124]